MSTRRRIAIAIAALGVLLVARTLSNAWPRETPILYEVGPDVGELDVDFLRDGEAYSSVRFRRPVESSPTLAHEPRLAPGTYQLRVTIRLRAGGTAQEVRALTVPAGDLTRIDLRPGAPQTPRPSSPKALRTQ